MRTDNKPRGAASRVRTVHVLGLRGDEAAVSALVDAAEPVATGRGEGAALTFCDYARALVYNGVGRYEAAVSVAQNAAAHDEMTVSLIGALPELVEAAARSGRAELATEALERLAERTQAAGTDLALGIEARSRALISEGPLAEEHYLDAIRRLARTRLATAQARAHLVYGEWLRREGRRIDAREQLHAAHDMLSGSGIEAFAERARRELVAAGEKARKRTPDTLGDLTAQEAQIADLARKGHSNPEIGAQLFLSPRTVEWHLHKFFTKLDITTRKELDAALRKRPQQPRPVSAS